MKTLTNFLIAIFLAFVSCQSDSTEISQTEMSAPDPEGEIIIAGADALLPLMNIWSGEFTAKYPKVEITVNKGGTGYGIEKLMKGEVDLAMVSRELTSEEQCYGLLFFPVSKEGVVPIINRKNPFLNLIEERGVTRNMLKKIFLGKETLTWGEILEIEDGDPIIAYTRSDISGAAYVWAKYLGSDLNGLNGIGVEGDSGMLESVIDNPFGFGYSNAHYAYDFRTEKALSGLAVVPIDLNCNNFLEPYEKFYERLCLVQRAAYLGKYPNLLCREIMLVSKGIPDDPIIKTFLKWIYREGQIIAEKNGYSRIRQCEIDDFLTLLEEEKIKE
jgi:phosphate transport system substrate-binding protein